MWKTEALGADMFGNEQKT